MHQSGRASRVFERGALRRAVWGAVVALFCVCLLPAPAHAEHPLVDEGMRLAGELELEAALDVFDRALASHELSREEVVQVLVERAFVQHALRDKDALLETFTWLAAFDPDFVLGVRAPPDMVAVWTSVRDQARGRLQVELDYEVAPGRLRAHPVLTGVQPPGLITELGLRDLTDEWELRVDSGGVGAGSQAGVERDFPYGGEVDLYVRLEGLGTELASDGSPDAPIHVVVPPLRPVEPPKQAVALAGAAEGDDRGTRRRRLFWIVGSVGALVLTGAVVAAAKWRPRADPPTTLTPQVPF